jgi:excisionase family DNA binding protein
MKEWLTTKELSKYININEKKIYELIQTSKLPSTRVTGKWLFHKKLIDEWLTLNTENKTSNLENLNNTLLIAGSNDILLEQLVIKHLHGLSLFSNNGSLAGLKAIDNNQVHICGAHLGPQQLYIKKSQNIIKVHFATRLQGLILEPGNPYNIKSLNDLINRKDIKFINRQKGSGTRLLLDKLLAEHKISHKEINGYENTVNTHLKTALTILNKKANVGLGIEAVASMLNLTFIPITQEEFSLFIPQKHLSNHLVQQLLNILNSNKIQKINQNLSGYNTKHSGSYLPIKQQLPLSQ